VEYDNARGSPLAISRSSLSLAPDNQSENADGRDAAATSRRGLQLCAIDDSRNGRCVSPKSSFPPNPMQRPPLLLTVSVRLLSPRLQGGSIFPNVSGPGPC
jgi:hypothetical protein